LWQRQVEEPAEERRLRDEIEALTPIDDETSRAVQQQYEENPYPRWHRVPASLASPFPLRRALREHFPRTDLSRLRVGESPGILIAGCGSGYQAAVTALRNPGARVLAVDLSRTSLAYALRRCRELRIGHVRFAQADILKLGVLPERFDLIECAGVLHHLRAPLEGWRVLESLLKPGGVMKVALYSERARQGVVAARELIARHRLGADPEGVRAARQLVFAEPEGSPARSVTFGKDFYSASGARDLVMHVQEHRFTTAQLAEMLRLLGLELLGFEFGDPSVPAAYRQRFRRIRPRPGGLRRFGRAPGVFAEMPVLGGENGVAIGRYASGSSCRATHSSLSRNCASSGACLRITGCGSAKNDPSALTARPPPVSR
jgi:SAM-dependent methyltransferase